MTEAELKEWAERSASDPTCAAVLALIAERDSWRAQVTDADNATHQALEAAEVEIRRLTNPTALLAWQAHQRRQMEHNAERERRAEAAEAKAAKYEADWVAAKHDFGVAMQAAEAKLAAVLSADWEAACLRSGHVATDAANRIAALEAKLAEAERGLATERAAVLTLRDLNRTAESDAKALREALGNLLVWAEWMRKRYRTPDMGEPNTGAIQAARAALAAGKAAP